MAEDGVNTIAANQARTERQEAEARGDTAAARELDALESEFLGGPVGGDDDDTGSEDDASTDGDEGPPPAPPSLPT